MEKIKVTYDRPTTNLLVIRCKQSLLNVSGPGSGYNKSGHAGNDMQEDDNYTYSF